MNNRINNISEKEIDEMIEEFENEDIDDTKWEGPFSSKTVKFSSDHLKETIQSLLGEIDNIEQLKQLEDYIKEKKESLAETRIFH